MTYYSYPGIVPFSALLPALQPPALAAYDQGYAAGYMEGLKDGQRRAAGLAPAPAYSAACWGAPPAHPPPPAAQPGWRSGVVIEELPQGAPLPAPDGAGPPPPSDAEAPRSLELLHRLLVLRGSMHAQRLMQLEKELLGMGGHISCLVGCVVRLKAGGSYFLAHITATRLGADGEVELVVHSMAHAISASAISSMPPLAAEEQQWVLGQGGRPTVAQAAAALAAGTWPFTAAAAAERLACPALVAREEQWVSARRA